MEASMVTAQDYVSLATYWHTLMKRRWTIATVAIDCHCAGSDRLFPHGACLQSNRAGAG